MLAKTITFADGRKLEIHRDEHPESPREWDNNGIMVCFARRYNLGDKHDHKTPDDFREWLKEQDVIAQLPLYLYDHSGITMSTGPFSCPWDSGQVGWIVATRESLESGGHDVDKLDVAKVETWLRGEVETYDQFLRGDIYGFILRKPIDPPCETCGREDDEGEEESSCWGFYGDNPLENGMADSFTDEQRAELKAGTCKEVCAY